MGRRKEKSDEQILLAARECFVRRGPTVPTSIIARELGISQATLFNRFKTKRELMLSALTLNTENGLTEILARSPDDRPIRQQLIEIGNEASKFFKNIDPNIAVLSATGMSSDEIQQCFSSPPTDNCYARLILWMEKAKQMGRVGKFKSHSFANAFLGAIRSEVKSNFDGEVEHIPDPGFIDNLVDLFWSGIEPGEVMASKAPLTTTATTELR